MKRLLCVAGLMALALGMSGCATPTKMPFAKGAEKVATSGGPILLMTATIKNAHHPSFQPELLVVNVETPDAKAKAQRFNFVKDDYADLVPKAQAKKNKKSKSKASEDAPPEGHTYLIRMQLPPGEYVIRGLTSMSQSFPIIATFFTPLHSPLKVSEGGVIYLGHVSATVRERQGEEFRAGSVIPLLDQAAAGASGGTFDVVISDELATDEKIFRERFVQLAGVEITSSILPPFDRDAAQKWWKEH